MTSSSSGYTYDPDTGDQLKAGNIEYDSRYSGLPCSNVQCAIDAIWNDGEPGPQGPPGEQGIQGEQGIPGPVEEALIDGTPYARQDAAWVPVTGGGGGDFFADGSVPMSGALVTDSILGITGTNPRMTVLFDGGGLIVQDGGVEVAKFSSSSILLSSSLWCSNMLINAVADPVDLQDAATKAYVDGLIIPLKDKLADALGLITTLQARLDALCSHQS